MSSSIFEVKESDSDNEKVLDFSLDSGEDNELGSSQIESDVTKDHSYTKEPDVLQFIFQEEELKDIVNANNQEETNVEDKPASPVKTKPSRSQKSTKKAVEKGKPKKKSPPPSKKEPPAKRGRRKKEELSDKNESDKETDAQEDAAVVSNAEETEESAKPAKRGRKRKVEEKENVNDQNVPVTKPPKKKKIAVKKEVKRIAPKREKVVPKSPKITNKVAVNKKIPTDGYIDHRNLPKGWTRQIVIRKTGKTAGQFDIYIYSPDGVKCRSRPDIVAYLNKTKSSLKIADFDFTKKTASENLPNAKKGSQKKAAPNSKSKEAAKKRKPVASPKRAPPKLLVKFVPKRGLKSAAAKKTQKAAKKTLVKAKKVSKILTKVGKKKKSA